jgi:hypothetical protein
MKMGGCHTAPQSAALGRTLTYVRAFNSLPPHQLPFWCVHPLQRVRVLLVLALYRCVVSQCPHAYIT